MSESTNGGDAPSYAHVVGGIFTRSQTASGQNSEDERGRTTMDAHRGAGNGGAAVSATPNPLGLPPPATLTQITDTPHLSGAAATPAGRAIKKTAEDSKESSRQRGVSHQLLHVTDTQSCGAAEECTSDESSEDSDDEAAETGATVVSLPAPNTPRMGRSRAMRAKLDAHADTHHVEVRARQDCRNSTGTDADASSPHPRSRTRERAPTISTTAPQRALPADTNVAQDTAVTRVCREPQQVCSQEALSETLAGVIDNGLLLQALQQLNAREPPLTRGIARAQEVTAHHSEETRHARDTLVSEPVIQEISRTSIIDASPQRCAAQFIKYMDDVIIGNQQASLSSEARTSNEAGAASDKLRMAARCARGVLQRSENVDDVSGSRSHVHASVSASQSATHAAAGYALERELTAENLAAGIEDPVENAKAFVEALSTAWIPGDPCPPLSERGRAPIRNIVASALPVSSEPRFTMAEMRQTVAEAVKVAVSESYLAAHSERVTPPTRQQSSIASVMARVEPGNEEPPPLVDSEADSDDDTLRNVNWPKVMQARQRLGLADPRSKPTIRFNRTPTIRNGLDMQAHRDQVKQLHERRMRKGDTSADRWANCIYCTLAVDGTTHCERCYGDTERRSLSRGRDSIKSGSNLDHKGRTRSPSLDDYMAQVTQSAHPVASHETNISRQSALRAGVVRSHQQEPEPDSRSSSRRRNISDVKLPSFNGNNWLAFQQQFESACQANGYTAREKGYRLRCALTGTAMNLLVNGGAEHWDYKTLTEALEARYGRTKARATIENQLNDMRKRPEQSAHEFADALDTLASNARMTPQIAASVTYHAFTNGIRGYPSMHKYVLSKDHEMTLRSAANLAAEWERSIGHDAPHADTWALLEAHRVTQANQCVAMAAMQAPTPSPPVRAAITGVPQGAPQAPVGVAPQLATVLERMAEKLDAVFEDAERRRQYNDARKNRPRPERKPRQPSERDTRAPEYSTNDRGGDSYDRRPAQDSRAPPFAFGQRDGQRDNWRGGDQRREREPRRDQSRNQRGARNQSAADPGPPPRDQSDRGRDA